MLRSGADDRRARHRRLRKERGRYTCSGAPAAPGGTLTAGAAAAATSTAKGPCAGAAH